MDEDPPASMIEALKVAQEWLEGEQVVEVLSAMRTERDDLRGVLAQLKTGVPTSLLADATTWLEYTKGDNTAELFNAANRLARWVIARAVTLGKEA